MTKRRPSNQGRRSRGSRKHLELRSRRARMPFGRRMENRLQQNNTRNVWDSMRRITGYNQTSSRMREDSMARANELNLFFNRFDTGALFHQPTSPSTIHTSQITMQPPSSPSHVPVSGTAPLPSPLLPTITTETHTTHTTE